MKYLAICTIQRTAEGHVYGFAYDAADWLPCATFTVHANYSGKVALSLAADTWIAPEVLEEAFAFVRENEARTKEIIRQ